jgi:threonine/homoserine/homoserine lactone efflux protein
MVGDLDYSLIEPAEYVMFIIAAYIMGFLAALPAGPVQVEVARRAISGHLRSSLMVVLGAFAVDVLYGVIAFFGIAPFLQKEIVMAVFWLIGGAFLLTLSYMVIKHSSKPHEFNSDADLLMKKRWGFISGMTLSIVNPMMIFWWLMGQRLFLDIGLVESFTLDIAVSFLSAAGLGLASYLTLLSLFLHWTKRFISANTMKWINLSFGIVLVLIALYFIFRSIRVVV